MSAKRMMKRVEIVETKLVMMEFEGELREVFPGFK